MSLGRNYLRYDVPEDRLCLDWVRIERVAKHTFSQSTRISIESHLTWYRDRLNYYDDRWNPKDYRQAFDALVKLTQTPGQRERWEGLEEPLEAVLETLEVFARPWDDDAEAEVFGDYVAISAFYFLLFQIWNCIGESEIKHSKLKGESQSKHGNDKVLTDAQLTLREICQQGIEHFDCQQSDVAFAKQLDRALRKARDRGDSPVAPAVPVSGSNL